MSYSLFILPREQKELAALPAQQVDIAESKIESLRENSRPPGCRKPADRRGWRIRFGADWVLYEIDGPNKTATITNAGNRRDIYR